MIYYEDYQIEIEHGKFNLSKKYMSKGETPKPKLKQIGFGFNFAHLIERIVQDKLEEDLTNVDIGLKEFMNKYSEIAANICESFSLQTEFKKLMDK